MVLHVYQMDMVGSAVSVHLGLLGNDVKIKMPVPINHAKTEEPVLVRAMAVIHVNVAQASKVLTASKVGIHDRRFLRSIDVRCFLLRKKTIFVV